MLDAQVHFLLATELVQFLIGSSFDQRLGSFAFDFDKISPSKRQINLFTSLWIWLRLEVKLDLIELVCFNQLALVDKSVPEELLFLV